MHAKKTIIYLAWLVTGMLPANIALTQDGSCGQPGQLLFGFTVNLPASGETSIQACQFSLYGCEDTGGFNYSFSSDPDETERIVTCENLGQEEIDIWIWDAAGNPIVAPVIFYIQDNLLACQTPAPGCSPVVGIANGLLLSPSGTGAGTIAARTFDRGTYLTGCSAGEEFFFSFSPDPSDSLHTFTCIDNLGFSPVQIWVTTASGQQAYAESFVMLQAPDWDCTAIAACAPRILAHNGLIVQLSDAQEVSISPDIFFIEAMNDCTGGSNFRLSFSSDVEDTALKLGCGEIGQHPVQLWVMDEAGNQGYIETFVMLQDPAGVCDNPVTIAFSPTDQACDAGGADLTPYIGAGPLCFNNIEATAEPGEVAPPQGDCLAQDVWCDGGIVHNSVWFTVTAPSTGNLRIETDGVLDMQLAVWQAGSCEDLLSGNAQLMGANDSRSGDPHGNAALEVSLSPGEQYFIQADGHGIAETGLFYLTLTELTDLREAPSGLEFALMPNPASGSVSVLFSGEITEEGHFTLFNAVGERIRSERIAPGFRAHPIDIGGLPPGIYFCHLSAGNKRHGLKKLIIL